MIFLTLVAVTVAGCGTSGESDAERYAAALDSTVKEFKEHGGTLAAEEIGKAKTRTGLEIAYLSYSTELTKLRNELEALAAPEECESISKEMISFVSQLARFSRAFGNQAELSPSELHRVAERQNKAVNGFANLIKRLRSKDPETICSG